MILNQSEKQCPSARSLLLFDLLNLAHRAYYMRRDATFRGRHTGTLHGVVMQLASTVLEIGSCDVIVCTDTRPYLRQHYLPEYKTGRSKNKNETMRAEFTQGLQQCSEFLRIAGILYVAREGLEADDLIAHYVRHRSDRYARVVAASNDTDLFQLFDVPHFELYRGKKKGFMTAADFAAQYSQLPPSAWVQVTALTGGHNGLTKIPGFGEIEAIRYICGEKVRRSAERSAAEMQQTIALNNKLARLPISVYRHYHTLPKPYSCGIDMSRMRAVTNFLAMHGINTTTTIKRALEII